MTIKEAAKELNEAYKSEKEKDLEKQVEKLKDRVKQLEDIIINLANRIDYLELRNW